MDTATAQRQTPEEAPLTITGISVGDRDGDLQTVTLSTTGGTLTLASTAGLTGLTGNGTGSVSFSGSVAAVNAALDGLHYLPEVDFNGNGTLSIATSDGRMNQRKVRCGMVTTQISKRGAASRAPD